MEKRLDRGFTERFSNAADTDGEGSETLTRQNASHLKKTFVAKWKLIEGISVSTTADTCSPRFWDDIPAGFVRREKLRSFDNESGSDDGG